MLCKNPCAPKATASTTLGAASIVNTMSASCTASAALLATLAPNGAKVSATDRVRLYTVISILFLRRFLAILLPIIPSPIKVIFMLFCLGYWLLVIGH